VIVNERKDATKTETKMTTASTATHTYIVAIYWNVLQGLSIFMLEDSHTNQSWTVVSY